jgi:hypothetical protein
MLVLTLLLACARPTFAAARGWLTRLPDLDARRYARTNLRLHLLFPTCSITLRKAASCTFASSALERRWMSTLPALLEGSGHRS